MLQSHGLTQTEETHLVAAANGGEFEENSHLIQGKLASKQALVLQPDQ